MALETAGHEWGHGLVEFTAGLSTGEAQALNESFADIFGFLTEQYAESKYDTAKVTDWTILEDFWPDSLDGYARRMDFPKQKYHPAEWAQPDTYLGDNW